MRREPGSYTSEQHAAGRGTAMSSFPGEDLGVSAPAAVSSRSSLSVDGPMVPLRDELEYVFGVERSERVADVIERITGRFPIPENQPSGCCDLLRSMLREGEGSVKPPSQVSIPSPSLVAQTTSDLPKLDNKCELSCFSETPENPWEAFFPEGCAGLLLQKLVTNEPKTHNLRKFFVHLTFVLRVVHSSDSAILSELRNGLLVARILSLILIESHGSPNELMALSQDVQASCTMDEFIRVLGIFCSNFDCNSWINDTTESSPLHTLSISFQIEAYLLLVVLLAPQMCHLHPGADHCKVVRAIEVHGGEELLSRLVCTLLRNYTVLKKYHASSGPATGIVPTIVSSISSIVLFPVSAYIFISQFMYGKEKKMSMADLALELSTLSLHLLLLLAHPSSPDQIVNPVRRTLNSLLDTSSPNIEASSVPHQAKVDFASVYDVITMDSVMKEETVLLLYFLLQGNPHFQHYVLSRTDPDQLLLPLMQTLCASKEDKSQHSYIILTVLLILSSDVTWNSTLHQIPVIHVEWFKDQYLTNMTLGGLLVVVLVRTVHINLRRLRDLYLHTNCLATLANMAPHFSSLPSYAASRLVRLVELIVIKCAKLKSLCGDAGSTVIEGDDLAPANQFSTYTTLLQSVLDILTVALAHGLERNIYLIYALLQQKKFLVDLEAEEEFKEKASRILQVVQFFEKELHDVFTCEDYTSESIIDVLQRRAPSCTLLRGSVAHLEFKYDEEETAAEFFNAYIWSVVFRRRLIPWDPLGVTLFPVEPIDDDSTDTNAPATTTPQTTEPENSHPPADEEV
ncbi:Dym protein [Pelomyxa schiedti]|nr:Dym protein [Pelomyxa schiedti]